ncbi:unnamed protein product [Allacma fusca]|uniref:Uncharacterized protein n=1 Tax=Allacma fusca TaxID=39272 RepID=A0A8J2JMB7_9HEXA|nr:unnamed protein product [Allacma fusca]
MTSLPSIAGMVDVRSSGILTDYIHSHEPCAPGAATYARKRMYELRLKLYQENSEQEPGNNQGEGSESITRPSTEQSLSQGRNRNDGESKPYSGLNPYGGNCFSGGLGDFSWSLSAYDVGYTKGKDQPYGGVTNSRGSAMQISKSTSPLDQVPNAKIKSLDTTIMPDDDNEDYSKFDRDRDWLTCFGACVIVACIIGIVQSYAVFAPAIQHYYDTGLVETILIGCLCYFTLLAFVPVSFKLSRCIGNRFSSVLGMSMFMAGLLLEGLTVGGVFGLYFTHIVLLGIGGSIAYVPAMTICSDHFRKNLGLALTLVSCAAPIGTMCVYLLSTLMSNFVNQLCLDEVLPFNSGISLNLTEERDKKLKATACPDDIPQKSYLFICVCDISFCDPFVLIWAGLTVVGTCTIFIPYLFLISYAYELANTISLGLICCCCIASAGTRLVVTNMNNHTFTFNRTLFQLSLTASGALYIALNWADTFGWVLLWGLIAGGVEGAQCIVIPRLTLQTVPFASLKTSCRWMTFFHACSVILGPMLFLCVYYTITDYAPAMVAIGIAQLIATLLVFLMPDVEYDELEQLEKQERELTTRS